MVQFIRLRIKSRIWFALACLSALVPGYLRAQQRGTAILRQGPVDLSHGSKYVQDKILVRFRPGTPADVMRAAHQTAGSRVLSELTVVDRLHVVQLAEGVSVREAMRTYHRNASVLYAEPDYIVQMTGTPNDPLVAAQWNMQNTGQNGGVVGADIHASQAWDISTGSANVVVAVLDTGIDYNHPDLAPNVWSAPSGFTATSINGVPVQCQTVFTV